MESQLKDISYRYKWTVPRLQDWLAFPAEFVSPHFPLNDESSNHRWKLALTTGCNDILEFYIFNCPTNNSTASISINVEIQLRSPCLSIVKRVCSRSIVPSKWMKCVTFKRSDEDINDLIKMGQMGNFVVHCHVRVSQEKYIYGDMSIIDTSCTCRLSGNSLSLMTGGRSPDLTLIIQGEEIRAHKAILSSSSPVFWEMIHMELDDNNVLIINDDFDFQTMVRLVLVMYVSFFFSTAIEAYDYDITTNHDLLTAAKKYKLNCKLRPSSILKENNARNNNIHRRRSV